MVFYGKFYSFDKFYLKEFLSGCSLTCAELSSCGDDGRIRGWKWKETLESEVPMLGNWFLE